MSDLTFNKIAGAVLATGLAIVGLRELSTGVFAQEHPEKPGYAIAVVEDTGGGATAEAPIDWGTVLPTADIKAGEAVFAKCKSCHTIDAGGPNGTGPNLNGVVGRKPGSHGGFAYSGGMTDFGGGLSSEDEVGAPLAAGSWVAPPGAGAAAPLPAGPPAPAAGVAVEPVATGFPAAGAPGAGVPSGALAAGVAPGARDGSGAGTGRVPPWLFR